MSFGMRVGIGVGVSLGLRGGPSVFDPLSLSPVAWYDAGDPTTLFDASTGGSLVADGGLVARWEDKSGNGNHLTQSTSGKRPVYDADGFMALGGIILNGTSTTLATALAGVTLGVDACSVFAMVQMDTAQSARSARLIGFQGNGETGDFSGPKSAVLIGLTGSGNAITGYRSAFKSTTPSASGLFGASNPSNYYRVASIWDGANHTIYLNEVAQAPVASTGNFASPGRLRLGSDVGEASFWKNPVKELIVLPYAADATQRAAVDAYLQSPWTRVLTTEGDSLTSGIGNDGSAHGYVYQALPQCSPRVNLHNVAIGGSRLNTNPGDVVLRTSNVDGQIPAAGKAGKPYIFYCAIGHNDAPPTDGQAAWFSTYESYLLARRAAGYDHILVGNLLPRTDAAYTDHNAKRAILNPQISAMCAANGFTLVDLAAESIMGMDGTPDNLTYFSDKIHPTVAGNALLAPILAAAVNAV